MTDKENKRQSERVGIIEGERERERKKGTMGNREKQREEIMLKRMRVKEWQKGQERGTDREKERDGEILIVIKVT